MKHTIKSAKLIDPRHALNGQDVDLIIEDGIIRKLVKSEGNSNSGNDIRSKQLCVSPGWIDLHVQLHDPGLEHKEDLAHGLMAAAAGGFTAIGLSPLSDPIKDSKAQIEYINQETKENLVSVYPYGAISKECKGEELAELFDLNEFGCKAFTDDKRSISNPNLLLRSLLYCQSFDGLVMNFPNHKDLAQKGVMNEGEVSTRLGLKGIPSLAEELMLARDLQILKYTGGKLHSSTLSTKGSLNLIREAKKKAGNISCDVSALHLLLNDEELENFDSRFKLCPPLRNEENRKALIEGIKDGTVDAICSDHWPENIENKMREFDLANFGAINLQTAFSAAYSAAKDDCSLEQIIHCFSYGPAKVLGIDNYGIKEGGQANLSFFDISEDFNFSKEMVLSKSNNSPLFNRNLSGKVIGCYNNGQMHLNAG